MYMPQHHLKIRSNSVHHTIRYLVHIRSVKPVRIVDSDNHPSENFRLLSGNDSSFLAALLLIVTPPALAFDTLYHHQQIMTRRVRGTVITVQSHHIPDTWTFLVPAMAEKIPAPRTVFWERVLVEHYQCWSYRLKRKKGSNLRQ